MARSGNRCFLWKKRCNIEVGILHMGDEVKILRFETSWFSGRTKKHAPHLFVVITSLEWFSDVK